MSWVREDDREATHPKTLALIEQAGFEAYYRLHLLRQWTAAHRTQGHFTVATSKALGTKPRQLDAMVGVGLVDTNGDGYVVHDHEHYNPPKDETSAERQARYRRRHRDGDVTP